MNSAPAGGAETLAEHTGMGPAQVYLELNLVRGMKNKKCLCKHSSKIRTR